MIEKLKKHKKLIIVILVVLLVVTGFFVFISRKRFTSKGTQEFEYTRTVTLSRSRLMDTIVATGVIESQTTSTITSSINGATVSKINYNIGDYVKEGDVIIELDTTSLNKQITKQSEKVTEQQDSLQERYVDALDDYEDAEDNVDNKSYALDVASNNFNAAKNNIASKQTAYNDAVTNLNNEYKTLVGKYAGLIIETNNDGSITIFDKTGGVDITTTDDGSAYVAAKEKMDLALIELNNAKEVSNYDALEKAYNNALNEYNQANSTYKQTKSAYEDAKENLDKGVDTDSLDELYDTAADYKLKAKSSGQITSMNAVLGSGVNGALATIQDTGKLKLSLVIDEYDILKLELGMQAQIQTDASDKIYEGQVSQISPTASQSMSSSGGFEIEVVVTSEDVSELLIGMNAEVTIIVSKSSENYNVPIDAVGQKADGTKVIYVQNSNSEFDELEIETGETNGYYVEIFSDELKDNMIIRASADEDEAKVKVVEDETFEEGGMFDFGDMPGGQGGSFTPPSGDGSFNPGSGFGGSNMPNGGPSFR